MEKFGFDSDPPLDYPHDQMVESGVVKKGGDLADENDGFDVGRVAIGQGGEEGQTRPRRCRWRWSPRRSGTTACCMRPRLTDRDRGQGWPRARHDRPVGGGAGDQDRVRRPASGDDGERGAVGHRARRRRSRASTVAGKTGTAERGDGTNNAWFIAFAPADDPKVAIAVVVESTTGPGRPGGRADRQAGDGDAPWLRSPRHDRRRPLPRAQPARLGRHGGRLLRRGHPPRPPGRAEGPLPPLRAGRGVRRALQARGAVGRRA